MTSEPSSRSTRSTLGIVTSIFVLLTILGAVKALFSVETTVLKTALVAWIALGIAILWLRWRPTK